MTYNEKKSLYESIMKEAAKTVKRMIDEAGIANISPIKDGKANMSLSKENFSFKIMQILY